MPTNFAKAANRVMLVILDGWGLSPSEHGNAPLLASTPTLDYIYASYPKTSLSASGLEVGLSPGEPGNSEVGHANIGSGRVVWENLSRINQSIKSKEVYGNPELKNFLSGLKDRDGRLHLVGLVSDGGVHSHIDHLACFLEMAKMTGIREVFVHFIADGRDTPPKKALVYLKSLEAAYQRIGLGRTATIVGRFYAMDRDNNWDRIRKAYDLFVENKGDRFATADQALEANYQNDKTDEFLEPAVIGEGGQIMLGDGILFFNHRSDRMRQLLQVFSGEQPDFAPVQNTTILTMTRYKNNQSAPVVFPPVVLEHTLPEIIAAAGLSQFHTAETEKFAHVTYFFQAGKEGALPQEKDELVASKKNVTYDKYPEMSAYEVTGRVKKGIEQGFDFIVVNYANGDMVGHTGVFEAAVKACEVVDTCLADIFLAASNKGYKVILCADHGNCETMIDDLTKEPNKEHTANPIPFVFLDFQKRPFVPNQSVFSHDDYIQYATGTPIGVLADVAPSILANLGLPMPVEMSGMDLTVAMG
jgi:2,3-bisphosphoglycerate-independent phosphoglycerate mutase